MSYHYKRAFDATDSTILPSIWLHYQPRNGGDLWVHDEFEGRDVPAEEGWWYAFGLPGCLLDSDPVGPFGSEAEALADARMGEPVCVEVSDEPCNLETSDDGWYATITIWLDAADAYREQSVEGCSIEISDGQGYAVLVISGAEAGVGSVCDDPVVAAYDALVQRLKDDGYDVRVLS